MALFDKFITTSLIKIAWIAGVVVMSVLGLAGSIAAGQESELASLFVIILTVLWIVVWRIVCESVILFYKMFEKVVLLNDNMVLIGQALEGHARGMRATLDEISEKVRQSS